ncbi:MAG: hypothetical protein ACK5JH_15510 [Anaerocolumna sp.]
MKDFGIAPCTNDWIEKSLKIFEKYENNNNTKFIFEKGIYHIKNHSTEIPFFITNSMSKKEGFILNKKIGLFLHHCKFITLDFSDSTILFHDKMCELVMIDCEAIKICNVTMDYVNPTVFEGEVVKSNFFTCEIKINNEYNYSLKRGRFTWNYNEQKIKTPLMVKVSKGIFKRGHSLLSTYIFSRTAGDRVKFYKLSFINTYHVGDKLHFRTGLRDSCGVFINKSKNIKFENVTIHFMHGLGVVSQFSRDLYFKNVKLTPRKNSQRQVTGFADLMHFSGCSGDIKISNSEFDGAHDDCINIHGTHLKIIKQINTKELLIKYMHPQTFGFAPYAIGDSIGITNPKTLKTLFVSKVICINKIFDEEWKIMLDDELNDVLGFVVENKSATPRVLIENNILRNVPTRAILVTTEKEIVIKNNLFENIPMASILIANDGKSWYESGAVKDVTIKNNKFVNCKSPIIAVKPENKIFAGYVHENIKICDNDLSQCEKPFFSFTNTHGIYQQNNKNLHKCILKNSGVTRGRG